MKSSVPMGPFRQAAHLLLKASIVILMVLALKNIIKGVSGTWLLFVPVGLAILVLWLNWRHSIWGALLLFGLGGLILALMVTMGLDSMVGETLFDRVMFQSIYFVPPLLLGGLLLIGWWMDRVKRH